MSNKTLLSSGKYTILQDLLYRETQDINRTYTFRTNCGIVISAFLVGLAVPAISGGLIFLKAGACFSNLHEIGVAIVVYAPDMTVRGIFFAHAMVASGAMVDKKYVAVFT